MVNLLLFYAAIILAGGIAIALFVAAIAIPVVLIFLRFGFAIGSAFAIATVTGLLIGARMSYGHIMTIQGADAGTNYLMILGQVFNTLPVELITAGLAMSAIGFAILLVGWRMRRA